MFHLRTPRIFVAELHARKDLTSLDGPLWPVSTGTCVRVTSIAASGTASKSDTRCYEINASSQPVETALHLMHARFFSGGNKPFVSGTILEGSDLRPEIGTHKKTKVIGGLHLQAYSSHYTFKKNNRILQFRFKDLCVSMNVS